MRLGSRLLPESRREWFQKKRMRLRKLSLSFTRRRFTAFKKKSTGVFFLGVYDQCGLYMKRYIDRRIKELFGDDLEITKHEYDKNLVLADFYYYFIHKPTGYTVKFMNHHARFEIEIFDGEWESGTKYFHSLLQHLDNYDLVNPYINILVLDTALLRLKQSLISDKAVFAKSVWKDSEITVYRRRRGRYRKIVYPNFSIAYKFNEILHGETDYEMRNYLSYRWRAFQYTDKELGLESLGDGEAYMVLFDVPACLLADRRVGSLVLLRDFNTHYYYSDSDYECLVELEKYRSVRKASRKLFKDITRFVPEMDLVVDVDSHADERKNDKSNSLGVYVRTRQGLYYRRVDLELENAIDQELFKFCDRLAETIRNRPIRLR